MNKNEIQFISQPQQVNMGDDYYLYARPNHFWLSWRYLKLKKLISHLIKSNNKLMEVGCGNSAFRIAAEEDLKVIVDGSDLNLYALENGFKGQGNLYVYNVFEKNEELEGKYDIVFLLDVIEHIEDDVGFVKATLKLLKEDGHLVINVPFGNWLFSKYDIAQGHKRRYNKKLLINCLKSAGLTVESISTWGYLLVPIAILRKLVLYFYSNEKKIHKTGFAPPHPFINIFFHFLKKIELGIPIQLPFGTSLIAVAKKQGK
ncbi:MAG: hypothetical protein Fur0010_05290 [Bdellovibrio sp.]